LLELLRKQNGKCALTGMPLTFQAAKGDSAPYNASIDCVIPISRGGKYEDGNIRLVCAAVNRWRSNTDDEQFIQLCRAVVKHNGGEALMAL
jgi:hypothetical protein